MKRSILTFICLCLIFCLGSCTDQIKILQFNIWQEGTSVENGYSDVIDEIVRSDADFITLSEVRNYKDVELIPRMIADLKEKGKVYYGIHSGADVGILSKYKIEEQVEVYPLKNDHGSVLKSVVQVGRNRVAVYSAHIDWLNCACYLPRGYNSCNWQKLPEPITDVDSVLYDSRQSKRMEAIAYILADAVKEQRKESLIFIGGDFNEPSHLDWNEQTKDLWDHRGTVIPWDCSTLLYVNGFLDAYRVQYPDVVQNPGFTFPAGNENVDIKKLAWAPDADERDRIDFIYYLPDNRLKLKEISLVGPSKSIVRGERVEETANDRFILPQGIWPTDHKAVLATFEIK